MLRTAALCLLTLAGAPALQAQEPAATFAPYDHWTRAVLRRIALDGVSSAGEATAAWPLREDVVARLLEDVTRAADDGGAPSTPPTDALGGFARLFARERRDVVGDRDVRVSVRLGAAIEGGWNELRAGNSIPSAAGYAYPGPLALRDREDVRAFVDVTAAWQAIAVRTIVNPPGRDWNEAYATASVGRVAFWGGRRGLSIGGGPRGGVVLADDARFTGGGIETAEPFRLPGFLRVAGDVRVSQTLARMERSATVDDPWFLATRISFAPHARFALGLNRAAIFGGEGNEPVTARRVLLMLIGQGDVRGKDSDFENQVASFDLYWRPPASVPLALYLEYGTEDRDGAIVKVPGVVLGVEAAPRAGSPWSAALEHVRLQRSTETYPEWYRHGALGGGWTDDGRLLGLPLGGHGHETSADVRYHDAPRGVVTSLRVILRDRGEENLFSPDREGGAVAAEARFVGVGFDAWMLDASGAAERGDGWRTGRLRVAIVRTF